MKKRILLIEDDLMSMAAISTFLEKYGHVVVSATSGNEALNMIQNEVFDIIVTDIMLPGVSGLTLVSLMQSFYFNNTPVIIISSLDAEESIKKLLDTSKSAFIRKPVDLKFLLRKINGALNPDTNLGHNY